MKLKKRDVYLLMILAGLLIALAAYQFVFVNYQDKSDALEAQNTSLQATVTELEGLEARRPEFEKSTEEMRAECDSIVQLFNSDTLMEDEIIYTYNMEQVAANDVAVSTMTLATPLEIPYEGNLTVGEYQLTDEGIRMYDSSMNFGFTTSYNGLKNIVRYLYSIPGRKALSMFSAAPDENGYLACSATVDFYHLGGTEIPYAQPDIPAVVVGTGNIFGILNNGPAYNGVSGGGENNADAGNADAGSNETEDGAE